jgi:hypothetical protein
MTRLRRRTPTTRARHHRATRPTSRLRLLLAAGAALGLFALATLVGSDAPTLAAEAQAQTAVASPSSAEQRALDAYETLPLSFTVNAGQADERARYLAQGAGYSFFFTDDSAVLSFAQTSEGLALELRFLGASPDARLEARHRTAGTVNHLAGDSGAWQSGLPTYEELTYRELWPGIDLTFRGERGTLKYEFHVRPGGDPSDIRLDYAGADGLAVDPDGSLAVDTTLGELEDARPVSHQDVSGERVAVDSRYTLLDGGARGYAFALGSDYDPSRPLVIDPGLAYSTFLGGPGGDVAGGIAVDESGSAYVTGETASAEFPTTPGAYDAGYNANTDAFVTKLDPSGSAPLYSTFVGGSAFDSGHEIAVDEHGSAYVTGFTGSLNYPTTAGAFDPSHNGGGEAFVTKLDPSGSALAYSTFLGGAGFSFEGGNGIAVDEDGSAHVTGFTGSGAYPTTPGAFDTTHNGRNDAFLTKLDPSGSALVYSTFLGGTGSDVGNAVAVDESGNAHVTGFTASADYPTTSAALDTGHNGGNDAFVTKLDPSGAAPEYSTFLGGAGADVGNGIAVDEKRGAAYVVGSTDSGEFPTTLHAFDRSYDGAGDAFVTKLDRSGATLIYSTFVGGTGSDAGNAIAVDDKGKAAHVTGSTDSADYPTTRHALDSSYNGGGDAFVTRLNRWGSALAASTFFGGTGSDAGNAIAVDEKGKTVHLAGSTTSGDLPTTTTAFDASHNNGSDAFVTALRTRGGGDEDGD